MDARAWERQLLANAEDELLVKGLAAVLVISAVGVGGAYLVAGRALRPLHRVTATAQRLSGETLDQRIRYDGADDEVAELAATFDAMLDRLNESFDSQKRFVANASHELRTPLAVMRTEIDVTLSDPDADVAEYRRMATVVRDASERANELVEALLVLARTDAQAGRRLVRKVPADLSEGASAALSAMQREIGRYLLTVETDLRPAPVVGDPGLLAALLGLLALTISLTFAPLGPFRLPASLLIAGAKAGLIYWVFMDLRKADALTRLAAAAVLFFLAVLLLLTGVDFALRSGAGG